MAVRIRMKKLGRTHRPFFRVCAVDQRNPRDGRVIEELGTYDPMCSETDARALLKGERVDYWLSVGAQPSDKVATLIKKYGTDGTHVEAQRAALERLKAQRGTTPPRAAASSGGGAAKQAESPKQQAEAAAEAAPPVGEKTTGEQTAAATESTGEQAGGE